jgi:glycerol transport system permease protein
MDKIPDNRAWWLVLPVFLLVAFSALIPLMTVVNYSVQDIFGPGQAYYVGTEWFKEVLADERLQDSLIRQFVFSGFVLLIQIPLGIGVALMMPKSGIKGSLCLILIAIPLLIPWGINQLGIDYNYTGDTLDAWLTVLLMDVWHWTPLVALLCYSGLRAIPEAFYQAAEIDRASKWAVFRYIQLPRLKSVLIIAVLLRFMDSFMIYIEPFVLTGGGPGSSTTFLSQTLTTMAIGQFDLGRAAAFSLIYFLIVLLISWLFFTAITHADKEK